MSRSKLSAQLLKKLVHEAGLCLQIPCESSQKLSQWVPLAGELLWLEDLQKLYLGDGKTPVSQLKPLASCLQTFFEEDMASIQAYKLWQELQSTACLYELIFKILPAPIHSEFLSQKPDNFTFLNGEAVKVHELASPYWKNYPDLRAAFLRNFDHAAKRDCQGDRFNGARQGHSFQDHKHEIQALSSNSLVARVNLKGSLFCSQGQVIAWPSLAKDFAPHLKTRFSCETRPLNACVLALMRVG